jgi:hypothetical protein
MKLKVFIFFATLSSVFIVNASSGSVENLISSEQSSSRSSSTESSASSSPVLLASPSLKSLTPKQLQAMRARQAAVVAAEQKKVEIGTVDVLLGQIDQLFIYKDGLYKGIGLRDFFNNYPDVINAFKEDAQYSYALPGVTVDSIHDVLTRDDQKREITLKKKLTGELTHYKILGTMPTCSGFKDNLFNINQAQEDVLDYVYNYIDSNYSDVRKSCTGLGLPNTVSQEVWRPGCCDVQIHRSCFKQCQHNMVKSCINPFCKKTEEGQYCRTAWTPDFYKQALDKAPIVNKKRIRDVQCPVCIEPLKPTEGILTTMIGKMSKNK